MKFNRSLCLAVAVSLGTGTAPAQTPAEIANAEAALSLLQRLAIQYVVLIARTAVDLTYDSLSIDSRNQETVINGLTIAPRLDWDPERTCRIQLDRLAGSNSGDVDRLGSLIEVSGMRVPAACFEPGVGAMLEGFGYPVVSIDRASMQVEYAVSSSAAQMIVSADLTDAVEITVAADFAYVWVTGLFNEYGEEPVPVVHLRSAEVAIENSGLWERVSPMLGAQFGDLNQIPLMVGPMLGQVLAEQPGMPLGPTEQAFADNLAAELGRFVQNGDRIVLTVAPEGGVWLSEELFFTPQSTIAALQPKVSGAPLSAATVIPPAVLQAALAGGAGLDEAAQLRAGRALIAGLGAPRAVAEGAALLTPLAEAWNGEAAALVAAAREANGDLAGAYAMALRAMAGGAREGLAMADGLETRLDPADVLAIQVTATEGWPGLSGWQAAKQAARDQGDVSSLRRLAFDASAGRNVPRNYAEAYFLASLAAAGGDAGAATLRDRLDARFTNHAGLRDAAWVEIRNTVASTALEIWTGGLATQVMTRFGRQ